MFRALIFFVKIYRNKSLNIFKLVTVVNVRKSNFASYEISTNIFMIDERVEYPEQCLIYTYLKISILSNLLIQRLNNNTFFLQIFVYIILTD